MGNKATVSVRVGIARCGSMNFKFAFHPELQEIHRLLGNWYSPSPTGDKPKTLTLPLSLLLAVFLSSFCVSLSLGLFILSLIPFFPVFIPYPL
jgi:hypothetical protein